MLCIYVSIVSFVNVVVKCSIVVFGMIMQSSFLMLCPATMVMRKFASLSSIAGLNLRKVPIFSSNIMLTIFWLIIAQLFNFDICLR